MKKKKKIQNTGGITICDSIVMSVKKKQFNLRRIESLFIALTGYISTIMVFLYMFDFKYSHTALFASAAVFSAIYIVLSLIGKNALWLILVSICAGGAALWKVIDSVALGYKFVYNIIYKTSYHTEIEYYKFLDYELEKDSVTTFFILGSWVLALVIYIFTIYHPHPLPPLIVVFPILEIGMYNGLEVNIFWGMMVIAYLVAGFAMSTIDMGEYSGGNGGFVRKENLFFPKRQMRLKVTEKCGVYLIILIMTVSALAVGGIKLTGYKRSDEINQRRIAIKDAVSSFSIEDLANSITDLSAAFGLDFKIEYNKLGNVASMKYKDRTDMTVTLDRKYDGAIYLKEYTGSVYRNNEWLSLPNSTYNSSIFKDFENYNIYPQDFPHRFNKMIIYDPEYTIWINSSLKGNRSFAPYGTDNVGILEYNKDCEVSSKKRGKNEFSYKFSSVSAELISSYLGDPIRSNLNPGDIKNENWKNDILGYCESKDLLDNNNYLFIDSELLSDTEYLCSNPDILMTALVQEDYEKFVYENYLQLPNDSNMAEVREAFSDILDQASENLNAVEQLDILYQLRKQVADMAEYSLSPGKTPKNRDFVNYFLLENHKGYCTHYATSGVMLSRMAGIPARYATGYVLVGDDFNSDTKNADGSYTIDVKDNRSHAWIEVYLSGYGWVPFEFTAGYTNQTIDTTPTTTTEVPSENTVTTTAEETPPDPSTTQNNPSPTPTATSNTNVNTTAAATSQNVEITAIIGNNGGIKLPEYVKYSIYFVLIVAGVIIFILLRRQLALYMRRRRFAEGTVAKRAGYMYNYVERLFGFQKIYRDDMQYAEFASYIEEHMGGVYFPNGSFEEFMDISLRAVFSESPPTKEELVKCSNFTVEISKKIYERASFFGKLYLKFVSSLI